MKKYIEILGNFIQHTAEEHPERARTILSTIYSYVRLEKEHKLRKEPFRSYEYMTGAVAGTIADSFKHPEKSIMVNIFLPCEISQSMGFRTMFPEGLSGYLACTGAQRLFAEVAESNDVPETFCSYHKTMLGAAESGVMPKPLMIANTTLCCDANQLSFRRLADFYQVPHVVIDVPHEQNQDAIDYVADQLRDLTKTIENVSGTPFSEQKLRETLMRSQRTIKYYRTFVERRGNLSFPSAGYGELCNMITTHMMLGTPEAEQYAKRLLKVESQYEGYHSNKKRIFWVHIFPIWQDSMVKIFDNNDRVELVGSDIATDYLELPDPEKPFESMAKRIVLSSYNGFGQNRIDKTIKSAKRANADGVIVFCHWGCKQTLGLSQELKAQLEAENIPTLVLDGDGCDARNVADGQMITRANAFIEQLEGLN